MDNILNLLIEYKYLILFPLAIVEGPILAVIGGFLCISGLMNPGFLYIVIIAGDMIGDSLVYALGRWGVPDFLKRIAGRFGLFASDIEPVRAYFDSNPRKTISLSKCDFGK